MKKAKTKRNGALASEAQVPPNTLGEFVQSRREELGISMRELARRSQVAHSFLSVLERDLGFASEAVLARIAKALELPFEELLKRDTSLPVDELSRLAGRHPEFRRAIRAAVHLVKSGAMSASELAQRIEGE